MGILVHRIAMVVSAWMTVGIGRLRAFLWKCTMLDGFEVLTWLWTRILDVLYTGEALATLMTLVVIRNLTLMFVRGSAKYKRQM